MPSIKDLKKRIGTVKNTQQTTKAMKMVSAAKLRRSQEAIVSHRPYAKQLGILIQELSGGQLDGSQSILISKVGHKTTATQTAPRVLLVAVTSDRGLCGGFNGSILKAALRWIAENQSKYSEIKLGFVGRKGNEFFKTRKADSIVHYEEFGQKVSFVKAKKLSELLVDQYLTADFDEIYVIYNEFKNAISQKVVAERFLPLNPEGTELAQAPVDVVNTELFLYRPSRQELLEAMLKKNFSVQVYRILLESQASEHGARMSAMENATKNAGEMIRKLTLIYNKQRQAGITKELLEIIAGSESQKQ